MRSLIESFLASVKTRASRKDGQTLVEYSMILGVLALVMMAVFHLLGAQIVIIFSAMSTILDTAQSSS